MNQSEEIKSAEAKVQSKNTERLYTKYEVDAFIKQTISSTVKGVFDYLASAHVFIIDKDSKHVIPNGEISCDREGGHLNRFVYKRLNSNGIEVITEKGNLTPPKV